MRKKPIKITGKRRGLEGFRHFSAYEPTPLADTRMISEKAEDKARKALEREAWKRRSGYK